MNESRAPKSSYSKVLKACPFWVKLFIVSLAIPTELSFSLGGLRFSPYRIVLLLAFFPALAKLTSAGFKKVAVADWFIILHVMWCFVVIANYHGSSIAIESGGIRMLEILGSYFLARAYVINERTYYATISFLLLIIAVLLPLALFESITGFHAIKMASAKLVGMSFHSNIEPRLGLTRAYVSFDHPILYGIFVATGFALSVYLVTPRMGMPRRIKWRSLPSAMGTFFSLSSGALTALIIQIILVIWEFKTRLKKNRWRIFSSIVLFVYIVVDMISNRSAMTVFLTYLTFSATTAWNRIIIFQFGIQDVWRNPIWGIGFNEWTRPTWMHSMSMDNFWLLQAVTFGLPGFFTLAIPFIYIMSKNWKNMHFRVAKLRLGWTISLLGLIISACTVHFWNNIFVYYIFILGLGGWFLNVKPPQSFNTSTNYY